MNQPCDSVLWPGWETVGIIGRGSFGTVYQIQRNIFGSVENAALKTISIPRSRNDIDELYSDGYSTESITKLYENHMQNIVSEYSLMRKLSGSANIVNCDDVRFDRHEDGIGWDIYIKMELLTPLTAVLPERIPEDMVIKLGIDMCKALEMCGRHNILHRDIKPQNIFVSAAGDYKLGDFGIAKTVVENAGGTRIGTPRYMAPEVFNAQPYGSSADLYSLGLVLYWMLNEKRMPFQPLPPVELQPGMDQTAGYRRMSGEPLPPPVHGSDALKMIVLKACAYHPDRRYASAAEMLAELNALQAGQPAAADKAMDDIWVKQPPAENLDVRQALQFAFEDNPAGKAIAVRVGSEMKQVWIPEQFTNGQTFVYKGMGLKSAYSERRGDLSLTIRVLPKVTPPPPAPAQKKGLGITKIVLLAAAGVALAATVVCVGIALLQRSGMNRPQDDTNITTQQDPAHQHVWTDATCTLPRTCNACGETEGEPLGHSWIAATYQKAETCERCQNTQGRSLPYTLTKRNVLEDSNRPNSVNMDVEVGAFQDVFGDVYSGAVKFWVAKYPGWDNWEYIVYDLNAEYELLEFTVVAGRDNCASGETYILIYADDQLIYESIWIGNQTPPIKESIDVTNVNSLKIKCVTETPDSCYCLFEGFLYEDG